MSEPIGSEDFAGDAKSARQTGYDRHTLAKVGQECFGALWVGSMAASLHVSVRSVQRWANGDYEVPPGIWRELVDICRERAVDLKAIANRLEKGESLG